MRIYLASSWRNQYLDNVCAALDEVPGITYYDFRDGDGAFHWSSVYDRPGDEYVRGKLYEAKRQKAANATEVAWKGFYRDADEVRTCEAMILVLPCGKSAHLELGYFLGFHQPAGAPTAIFMPEPSEPELMYNFSMESGGFMTDSLPDLQKWANNNAREISEELEDVPRTPEAWVQQAFSGPHYEQSQSAVKEFGQETLIFDTPDGIAYYQLCVHIASLKIEINTGMKHSAGSVLRAAQVRYGVRANTKKAALQELLEIFRNTYGREYGEKAETS